MGARADTNAHKHNTQTQQTRARVSVRRSALSRSILRNRLFQRLTPGCSTSMLPHLRTRIAHMPTHGTYFSQYFARTLASVSYFSQHFALTLASIFIALTLASISHLQHAQSTSHPCQCPPAHQHTSKPAHQRLSQAQKFKVQGPVPAGQGLLRAGAQVLTGVRPVDG